MKRMFPFQVKCTLVSSKRYIHSFQLSNDNIVNENKYIKLPIPRTNENPGYSKNGSNSYL